jgi:hypothetical protein
MHYPYNAIFERGLLKTFEDALYSGYLFCKILATFGVITTFGNQKDARNNKQGFTPSHKNVHFLREESEQYQQPACPINLEAPTKFKKAIKAEGDFEKLSLDLECPTELFALAPR